jgi:TolA-binding protein
VPNTYFTRGEQRAVGNRNTIYQETIQEFNKFIKAYPKSKKVVEAEFNIAACLEELDQLESAFQIYERIKNDYPSPKVVQIKLHRITERRTQRNR